MMLEDGGGCQQSLPPSFRRSVLDRKRLCGQVSLTDAGFLTPPHDPTGLMPVVEPSYSHLDNERQATHPTFVFFTILIMYLFFTSITDEFRDLIKTTDFLCTYPGVADAQDRGGEDRKSEGEDVGEDAKRYRIGSISVKHRATMAAVLFLRIVILVMLTLFGTWFLLTEVTYMELVLNAVSLSFITGIDEVMFEVFMESSDQKEIGFDEVERVSFKGHIPREDGSVAAFCFRKDVWGLALIPVITLVVVFWYTYLDRMPAVGALTCSCLQEGEHCAESMVNQEAWWTQYWRHTLPAAIHQMEAMRLQGQ